MNLKKLIKDTIKKPDGFRSGKIKLTKCCNSYSTYYEDTLCCKVCYKEVEFGEGDGTEFINN